MSKRGEKQLYRFIKFHPSLLDAVFHICVVRINIFIVAHSIYLFIKNQVYSSNYITKTLVLQAKIIQRLCLSWKNEGKQNAAPHESNLLRLVCSKMRHMFGWKPVWDVSVAMEKTVEWEKTRKSGGDIRAIMDMQIDAYMRL